MNELDADRAPDAADALVIIEHERTHTTRQLTPNLSLMAGMWGVAWLVGGVVQFGYLRGGLPGAVAAWTGVGLLVVASAASIVLGVRSGRGVRGSSETQGALYGWSWTIAMTAMGLVVGATAGELPPELRSSLIPALFVLLAGVLYLAGGAIWRDTVQYVAGVWLVVMAVVSVIVGSPAAALVLGIGGGGGLLVAAALYRTR